MWVNNDLNIMWNMFTVINENTRTMFLTSFLYFYSQFWTGFTPCSCALVANFEKVMIYWEGSCQKHNSKQDLAFYLIL